MREVLLNIFPRKMFRLVTPPQFEKRNRSQCDFGFEALVFG